MNNNRDSKVHWKAIVATAALVLVFLWGFVYGIHHRYVYFASLMALFFVPSVLLGYYIHVKGNRWITSAAFVVLTICFLLGVLIEFVAVQLKFWTFFTDVDPLLSFSIGDIPVEEFLFYFGANMQLCFLYIAISLKCDEMGITPGSINRFINKKQDEKKIPSTVVLQRIVLILGFIATLIISIGLFKKFRKEHGENKPEEKYRDQRNRPVYIEGVWYPGWFIAIFPFLAIGIFWLRAVWKRINGAAFLITLVINCTLYLLFEYNAIMRGHWVYNEQRLLGWRFADTIPLEQLILYFVSFLFLIPFFESMRYILTVNFGTEQEKQSYATLIGDEELLSVARCRSYISGGTSATM